MEQTTLLYFFSALAQSAAAFAALIGVFAVFRLQLNNNEVKRRYDEARFWMKGRLGSDALTMSNREVEILLGDGWREQGALWAIIKNQCSPEVAIEQKMFMHVLLSTIKQTEDFHKTLAGNMTAPLKLWGYIFLFSLLALAMSHFLVDRSTWVIVVALTGSMVALWRTKRFLQRCLEPTIQA